MNLCGSSVCWTVRLSYNPNDPYEAKYYRVPVESLEAFLVDAKKSATELRGNSSKKGKKCRIADNVFGGDRSTTRQRDQGESQATPFFQPGTSLKKALFFVLSARCFLIFQIENGRDRLGQDEK